MKIEHGIKSAAAKMIAHYNPFYEMVVQYLREDGCVRTARIRTAPGKRHPKRISFFETMMQKYPDGC